MKTWPLYTISLYLILLSLSHPSLSNSPFTLSPLSLYLTLVSLSYPFLSISSFSLSRPHLLLTLCSNISLPPLLLPLPFSLLVSPFFTLSWTHTFYHTFLYDTLLNKMTPVSISLFSTIGTLLNNILLAKICVHAGTVSRGFLYWLWCRKNSSWASYNHGDTVSRNFWFCKVFGLRIFLLFYKKRSHIL